jgi:rod shape-determining protein MreD
MKKIFINIAIIISFIFIYLLQANFFTWFKIAGVMPNLIVILMLYIGLFMGKKSATTYGIVFGMLVDIFISRKLGITSIMLAAVGIIADLFDKNFSKDNRITVMAMVGISTIIYEIGVYMISYALLNINIETLAFTKILIIETIYNVILTIIIYPIMQLTGYDVEEEYKGSKILTRYF